MRGGLSGGLLRAVRGGGVARTASSSVGVRIIFDVAAIRRSRMLSWTFTASVSALSSREYTSCSAGFTCFVRSLSSAGPPPSPVARRGTPAPPSGGGVSGAGGEPGGATDGSGADTETAASRPPSASRSSSDAPAAAGAAAAGGFALIFGSERRASGRTG